MSLPGDPKRLVEGKGWERKTFLGKGSKWGERGVQDKGEQMQNVVKTHHRPNGKGGKKTEARMTWLKRGEKGFWYVQ